jgi:hypothetical protein
VELTKPSKRTLARQDRARANGRRGRRAYGPSDVGTRTPERLRRAISRAKGKAARAARKANR